MSYDIEAAVFCADYLGVFMVPASNGKDKYTVTLSGPEGGAHCDCMAFKYFKGPADERTCKHIKQVWDEACLWNPQWHEGGPDTIDPVAHVDVSRFVPGQSCPECGGPVFPVRIAV